MKPLIGLTADYHDCASAGCCIPARVEDEKVVVLGSRYQRAILDHGGLPVILPLTADKKLIGQMAGCLAGLLIPGGAFDVPPEFYGEEPAPGLGPQKPERSAWERDLIRACARRRLPILGICGGLQILNVAFGGTLIQDLTKDGVNPHQQNTPRYLPWHRARIVPNSMLARIMGAAGKMDVRVLVNSTHHQAVKQPAPGFTVVAVSEDGTIEAIMREDLSKGFVMGVQWHPEMLFPTQPEMAAIFKAFIGFAKKRENKNR
jgi:putative glutamine amidotransferase